MVSVKPYMFPQNEKTLNRITGLSRVTGPDTFQDLWEDGRHYILEIELSQKI